MEQALETQRVKLLRLLAGWFAIVEWMSAGPFSVELPHWVRAFLASILIRAEFAAQSLVIVSACLSVKNSLWVSLRQGPALPSISARDGLVDVDLVPSTKALLQRMKALRVLLQNLSRHGLRLTRRLAKRVRGHSVPRLQTRMACEGSRLLTDGTVVVRRIERPPDKAGWMKQQIVYSLPISGREAKAFVLG